MADPHIDDVTNQILDALDSEPSGDTPSGDVETEVLKRLDGGDTVSDQPKGETEGDTTAEAVEADGLVKAEPDPPIEPPASWKAEAKERFKALPRDLQQVVAERESEREKHFSKTQQESAEAKKAHEAQLTAVQDERKAIATRLTSLIDLANTIDPVIAEGRKTDWAQLHKDDPLGAPAKWFEYQQRHQQIKALEDQRNEVLNKMRFENYQKGDAVLREKLDFWADDGKRKAFQSKLAKLLVDHGYSREEAGSIDDHRAIIIGSLALEAIEMRAQQAKIAAAKVVPIQGKTARTQANDDQTGNPRAEALMKRARKTGRTDDAAEAILAAL